MKNKLYGLLCVLGITIFLGGCSNQQSTIGNVGKDTENVAVDYVEDLSKNKEIVVDGGDMSGEREPNVKVDIGFGDREYWAYTNKYGQLVRVEAEEIILQDDNKEPVTSEGRYYRDEAKVLGVERDDLDEGHIIADSLGGVSNAYNITPQDSTLNRHGDQAYMEDAIRDAGGCSDFVAIITYPDSETQIPSHYSYTYTLKGNVIEDEFDNGNPDKYNEKLGLYDNKYTSDDTEVSNDYTVWVTKSGKKYHSSPDCSSLSRSSVEEVTLEEAKSRYLEPCKKCY